MKQAEGTANSLQQHIAGAYFSQRLGMGVIAGLLPVLLWLGGLVGDHESLRCSMSAYYYSQTMRDVFVGALVAIGAFLYLYKGFSTQENVSLNLAGTFAVGIALVPTAAKCGAAGKGMTVHAGFAILFFVCIAYVAMFRATDTLSLIRDAGKAGKLRNIYRLLGIGMVACPVAAVLITLLFQSAARSRSTVFGAEAAGVLMFSVFWIVKSLELRATDADRLALERKLKRASGPKSLRRAPGVLVQTAVTDDDEPELDQHA